MKIGIANDHNGYKLKTKLIPYLQKKGYEVEDYGTDSIESVDYPDFGILLGEKVRDKEVDFGIGICGSGVGITIACNKVNGVRCAKADSVKDAKAGRLDSNANIVALSGKKFLFEAKDIVDAFLNTTYKEEERFERRINKLKKYEEKSS